VTRRKWIVRLSDTAEADYDDILRWTTRQFGTRQAAAYGALLAAALTRLERGPSIAGTRSRGEIGEGLLTLHLARRGRHLILFRVGSETERTIDVLRILHDAMDLARHVKQGDLSRKNQRPAAMHGHAGPSPASLYGTRGLARKSGSARTHLRHLRFNILRFATGIRRRPGGACPRAATPVKQVFNRK